MAKLNRAIGSVALAVMVGVGIGCRSVPRLMPTPNVVLANSSVAFEAVPEALQSNVVDILYVTDRKPTSTLGGQLTYGHERSRSLAFGSAFISLGKDVPWSVLKEDSRTRKRSRAYPVFLREVWERGRFPETPYLLEEWEGHWRENPDLEEQEGILAGLLRAEVQRRLALTPRKEVVVFVHGFNNSFDDAVVLAGELWHFAEREGVMICYTWPAGIGGLRGYAYDRESGEFTVHHLKQFLRILLNCGGVDRVHLLAHSRGTDVLTSALRELVLEAREASDPLPRLLPVANLILAAPDLDLDVSGQRIGAEYLHSAVERFTIYACQEDRAITLSNWLFEGFRRLGVIRPEDLTAAQQSAMADARNFHVVDVQGGAGFLSHGYFHENPAASSDLLLLLRENCDPGKNGPRPLEPVVKGFWRLQRDYP
jgi:esterase/lipase superfamily enzyme